jgi:hypothetical protein
LVEALLHFSKGLQPIAYGVNLISYYSSNGHPFFPSPTIVDLQKGIFFITKKPNN